MMETIIMVAIGWVACGVVAAGIDVADFQGRWPMLARDGYRCDLGNALIGGLMFGPIALLVNFCTSGFCEYGWHLRRKEPKP